jgi:hypothetical protein
MDTIREKTYFIMSNPTAISQGLIALTSGILLYYTFHDKEDATEESAAPSSESSDDESEKSEEKPEESAGIGGLFGAEEKPEESAGISSGISTSASDLFGAEEKPEEEKKETIGGKRKKTRRSKKHNSKTAKHKK